MPRAHVIGAPGTRTCCSRCTVSGGAERRAGPRVPRLPTQAVQIIVAAGVQNFALCLAKGCAKCRIGKRTERRHWNACVPQRRFTVCASASSYSALLVFIWRLPITSIVGMSTAQRTAATNTRICKRTVKQAARLLAGRAVGLLGHVRSKITSEAPTLRDLIAEQEPGPLNARLITSRCNQTR